VVAWWLDPAAVLSRLADLHPGWAVAALLVSVIQVVGSAWRWRYIAGRLGQEFPLGWAVGEYYRATLLNQVLPGGVAGDVSRAWRHAGPGGGGGKAVSAVVLDRLSGQAVMTVVAALSGLALVRVAPGSGMVGAGVVGATLLLLVLAGPLLIRGLLRLPPVARVAADARVALLGPALPVQLSTSLAVVASYLIVFVMAARSVGVETPLPTLLPLVAPVLVTMLLPVTVAGWGLREGAAAALWHSVGLTPADGVAVSVAYGGLVLVSSLPGLLLLGVSPRPPSAAPGRAAPPENLAIDLSPD
jgi:uncharacterized membrane protein YbhN (UPF0104 family)